MPRGVASLTIVLSPRRLTATVPVGEDVATSRDRQTKTTAGEEKTMADEQKKEGEEDVSGTP